MREIARNMIVRIIGQLHGHSREGINRAMDEIEVKTGRPILDWLKDGGLQAIIEMILAVLTMFKTTQNQVAEQKDCFNVETVMTSILGSPKIPNGFTLPAGVDWEKLKEGLRRWLPMLKLIAATTANKYDDAVVSFLESLLASEQ